MTLSFTTILFIGLSVIILILLGLIIRLELKFKKMMIGKGSTSIEDSINAISLELKDLTSFRRELEHYLTMVEKRLRRSVQGIHTLRFNPFKGTGSGGNQSFATAILNEDGDGVIISSLYSREHVSIFSKPVKQYVSEFELSEEEKEALSKAKELVGEVK